MNPGVRAAPGRLPWLALVVVGVAAVGFTAYAAGAGVRGSDQYWYMTDVTALARDGVLSGNTVFPVALLGPSPVLPPPFIHNVLSVFLAAVPALVVGAYDGWLVLNVASTLLAAVLIYLAARTVASRWAAVLCAAVYPLLPMTVWHTAQPLAEASIACFAALAVYLLSVAGTRALRWLALVGALGLLFLSRESYLPLLLLAPIAFLVVRTREHAAGLRGAVAPAAALAVAVVLIVVVANAVVPADNVRFSYGRLLHAAVPGSTSNMSFNFDLSPENLADRLPFDVGLLAPKLAAGLADQFVRFDSVPVGLFYWGFNVLAIVAVVMLWRCRRRPAELKLVAGALAFVAVHAMTVALFQNQVRYTLPAIPGLLVVLAIALSGLPLAQRLVAPRLVAILLAVTVAAGAADLVLARTLRGDAETMRLEQTAVTALFDRHLGPTDPAMIVYAGTPQMLAYAARPRLVVYVAPDYTPADIGRLRAAMPTDWILVPLGDAATAPLGLDGQTPVDEVDALGKTWGLYRLPG